MVPIGNRRRSLAALAVLGAVCAFGPARAEDLPQMERRCINDHAGLLGKKARAAIRGLCDKARDDGVEMMVVTVGSLGDFEPRPLSLDTFVQDVFDMWEIDYDAANHAILLFIARKERQLRIRMGEAFAEKARKRAHRILRRTIGPGLGRGASRAIRRGFGQLYHKVARPHIRARERERERKRKAAQRKRGVVDFD
jgi:uncharacterized protein